MAASCIMLQKPVSTSCLGSLPCMRTGHGCGIASHPAAPLTPLADWRDLALPPLQVYKKLAPITSVAASPSGAFLAVGREAVRSWVLAQGPASVHLAAGVSGDSAATSGMLMMHVPAQYACCCYWAPHQLGVCRLMHVPVAWHGDRRHARV
jgi:hypothetical protein